MDVRYMNVEFFDGKIYVTVTEIPLFVVVLNPEDNDGKVMVDGDNGVSFVYGSTGVV